MAGKPITYPFHFTNLAYFVIKHTHDSGKIWASGAIDAGAEQQVCNYHGERGGRTREALLESGP
jgi:hypothetical protein